MPETELGHGHTSEIRINNKPYLVSHRAMTGLQLRALAEPRIGDADDLFLEAPGPGQDPLIRNDEPVEIETGMHFRSASKSLKEHHIEIHIDNAPYIAPEERMTGMQLRELAKPTISADYDLFMEIQGVGDDPIIGDAEGIRLENGMHFYSVLKVVNPGGSADATA